jgi:hypothetical protein
MNTDKHPCVIGPALKILIVVLARDVDLESLGRDKNGRNNSD